LTRFVAKVKKKTISAKLKKGNARKLLQRLKTPLRGTASATSFSKPEDVEVYYANERKKIDAHVHALEVQRAKGYLDVVAKQTTAITQKVRELDLRREEMKTLAKTITSKIALLSSNKEDTLGNFEVLRRLEQSVATLDNEEHELESTRSELLAKEKRLVNNAQKMVTDCDMPLKAVDAALTKSVAETEQKKFGLVVQSKMVLANELNVSLKDDDALQKLVEAASQKVKDINSRINELGRKRKKVIERLHLVDVSEHEAKQELRKIEQRKNVLRKEYVKLLRKK